MPRGGWRIFTGRRLGELNVGGNVTSEDFKKKVAWAHGPKLGLHNMEYELLDVVIDGGSTHAKIQGPNRLSTWLRHNIENVVTVVRLGTPPENTVVGTCDSCLSRSYVHVRIVMGDAEVICLCTGCGGRPQRSSDYEVTPVIKKQRM